MAYLASRQARRSETIARSQIRWGLSVGISWNFENMIAAADKALGVPAEIIGGTDDKPRFELFHAAASLCSQKVRAVLAHHRISYASHSMNIFKGETYLPDYIRLRMMGCARLGLPLVSGHSGSTAVAGGGCDPTVVPSLVDRETDEVLVDSLRIRYPLDNLVSEPHRLRPKGLQIAVDTEIEIVDHLPNYQMMAGLPPAEYLRPTSRWGADGTRFAREKVQRCDAYLAEFAGHEVLMKAYNAKRAKELEAWEQLFSEVKMRAAYERAQAACRNLAAKLAESAGAWLFGDRLTLADLFWAIELQRIKTLGASFLWEERGLQAVTDFVRLSETLPAIRAAIIDWPGAVF